MVNAPYAFCMKCGMVLDGARGACPACGHELESVDAHVGMSRGLAADRAEDRDEVVFAFSAGSYFGGWTKYQITRRGDMCTLSTDVGFGSEKHGCISADRVKRELIDYVFALDWEENYRPSFTITDGYTWSLEASWDGEQFKSSGYVERPGNYDEVTAQIAQRIGNLKPGEKRWPLFR